MRADGELAAAFRDGDDRAFAALYERYKRPLYMFALRMLGEADGARDLVQDVFLRVFERRTQLHRPDSFRGWLFAIGRNRCLTLLREGRRQAPLDEAPPEAIAIEAAVDGLEAEQDVQRIRQALAGLKVEHREVLILREYQDLSYQEIAQITESSESAVKSRLFKARRALHDALKPAMSGRR
jgi:RNA polymerase sigma-70 factor, ECF subfamily